MPSERETIYQVMKLNLSTKFIASFDIASKQASWLLMMLQHAEGNLKCKLIQTN